MAASSPEPSMHDRLESLSEEQRSLLKQINVNQVIQAKLVVDGDKEEGQLDEGVEVDLLEKVARVVNVSSVRTAFRRWLGVARQATSLLTALRKVLPQVLLRAEVNWAVEMGLAFRRWQAVVDNTMVTQAERRADKQASQAQLRNVVEKMGNVEAKIAKLEQGAEDLQQK
jgi:hypothetical protein